MKKLVSALAALTCGALSAGVIRIMPLGDSITDGVGAAGGYRLPLYNLLKQANYTVDYVGSMRDNGAPDLPDWDHEGHSGWWIMNDGIGIYQNVGKWLAHVDTPDVVLLHIGTNDGGYATVEKLRNLVMRIHNLAPKTHIVATTLLGRPTQNAGYDEYIRVNFNPGVQAMVEGLARQGVPVHFLDMYSVLDYSHEEGAHPADLVDGLHPSAQGYAKMAQAWFGAITDIFGDDGSTFTSDVEFTPLGLAACDIPASETQDYIAVYSFDITSSLDLRTQDACNALYFLDRSKDILVPFDRIAYLLELHEGGTTSYAWVSVDAFTNDVRKIGVPTLFNENYFQGSLSNMNVFSNVSGVQNGVGIQTGNIEFWPWNYGNANKANIPGAEDSTFDFGDECNYRNGKYASMQIHNYGAGQTIFAVNNINKESVQGPCVGIGNNTTGEGYPDWTFATTTSYKYDLARMTIYVRCASDTTPPALVSARGMSVDGRKVDFAFDEPVVVSGLSGVSFAATGNVAMSAEVHGDNRTVSVVFSKLVAEGSTVSVSGVCDYSGNIMEQTSVTVAERAGLPDDVAGLVGAEAEGYVLLAEVAVPVNGDFNASDRSYVMSELGVNYEFDRVAYCLVLTSAQGAKNYAWTSFDAMTLDTAALGVPIAKRGRWFQQKVGNLRVKSNVGGVANGAFADGSIEFWPCNYGTGNNATLELGGSGETFDFDDVPDWNGNPGHGAMQVHNYREGQTVWAVNRFGLDSRSLDIGIGNNGNVQTPDWTNAGNAGGWAERRLYILVHPGKPSRDWLAAAEQSAWDAKYADVNIVDEVSSRIGAELDGWEFATATDIPANSAVSDANWRAQNLYKLGDRRAELSSSGKKIARVGYYMQLKRPGEEPVWIWTAMDAFTQDIYRLGIPEGGYFFKEKVGNLVVRSNSPAVTTGNYPDGGIVEFWASNYNYGPGFGDVGGSGSAFDWDDGGYDAGHGGHGSMQVHNWRERQVLWSLTKFNNNNVIGIGIGNDTAGGANIDYTFNNNGGQYEIRRLAVFVKFAVASIDSVQVSADRKTVLVEFSGDLALGAAFRMKAEIDGADVTQAEPVGENALRLHVSGLAAGTSYYVTLRNVETAEGVLDAVSARFDVSAQGGMPGFLGSVAEASSYTPILATPNLVPIPAQNFTSTFKYDLDTRRVLESPFDRIAFAMELVTKNEGDTWWVWVSMDSFTDDPMAIGVPYYGSGIYWQQTVTDMTVASSGNITNPLTTGEHLDGNLEFWSNNYGGAVGLAGIGGDPGKYDFNDTVSGDPTGLGYGSMQIHNWKAGETIFAFNRFGGGQSGALDISIGTWTSGNAADWTQMQTANSFSSGKIYAFVRKVPPLVDEFGTPLDFIAQPRNRRVKVHETAYFAARAIDATSYQWFKNGSPIPGANASILELSDVGRRDAGAYKVLAIGPDGASFSKQVTLTVIMNGTIMRFR